MKRLLTFLFRPWVYAEKEKRRRIYYQNQAYAAASFASRMVGHQVGTGTIEEPDDELCEVLRSLPTSRIELPPHHRDVKFTKDNLDAAKRLANESFGMGGIFQTGGLWLGDVEKLDPKPDGPGNHAVSFENEVQQQPRYYCRVGSCGAELGTTDTVYCSACADALENESERQEDFAYLAVGGECIVHQWDEATRKCMRCGILKKDVQAKGAFGEGFGNFDQKKDGPVNPNGGGRFA